MDKIEGIMSELKSIVDSPRVYIVNHFDGILNQIDFECQIFLNRKDLGIEERNLAIHKQAEMVTKVNSLKKQCLEHLEIDPIERLELEEFNERLKDFQLYLRLGINRDATMKLFKEELDCKLIASKKALFMNKVASFISIDNYTKYFEHEELVNQHLQNDSMGILFGILILAEDEYLLSNDKKCIGVCLINKI